MINTCKKCGLPLDLCACEDLEKSEMRVVIRLEMRRFKKPTTMIEGLNPKRTDLDKIAQRLKTKLACGGTVKDGYILLQGDHRDNVKEELVRLGFDESSIEVQ
ncbi:MAG: stress response translation initiation inhibitor YciH [Nitrososphaerales archaeon]